MSAGQRAIDTALGYLDAPTTIDSVKEIVAKEIERVDPALKVRKTGYFNHSYIPDLVTWWGTGDADHREIFLRFDSVHPDLALDIEKLNRDHPMFFSLRSRNADEAPPEISEALSRHCEVMVTAADTLGALTGSRPGSFDALVSKAVVQSGRGLVDADKATQTRKHASAGVAGALCADESLTRVAVMTAQDTFMDAVFRRINKYLQLLWLAGGGAFDSYPGRKDVPLGIEDQDIGTLIRPHLEQ